MILAEVVDEFSVETRHGGSYVGEGGERRRGKTYMALRSLYARPFHGFSREGRDVRRRA